MAGRTGLPRDSGNRSRNGKHPFERHEAGKMSGRKVTHTVDAEATALAEVVFIPTAQQKKAKHMLQAKWGRHDAPEVTDVVRLTRMQKVKKWWIEPGFVEWLLGEDSMMGRLNYLVDVALDTAENILTDEEANQSAKVNMVKTVLAYKEAIEKRIQEQANHNDGKSRAELIKLVKEKTKQLGPVLDAEEET